MIKNCGEIWDGGKVNEGCRDVDNKITDQTKPEMDKFLEGMRINRMYTKMFYDMMEGHFQLTPSRNPVRNCSNPPIHHLSLSCFGL